MMETSASGSAKPSTTKQMGDACEMLVAAELTLAGVPAMKAPDFWPGYDVIAQNAQGVQRISVKSRTFKKGAAFIRFAEKDPFDWLAIVLLPAEGLDRRRIFVVPSVVARARATTNRSADGKVSRDIQLDKVVARVGEFENNFRLFATGCPPNLAIAAMPLKICSLSKGAFESDQARFGQ